MKAWRMDPEMEALRGYVEDFEPTNQSVSERQAVLASNFAF